MSLCFLWLPSFFHSLAGGSDWISHEALSLHFSQTPASAFLFSLQFCSLGLRLWHCQKCWRHSTESWESEVQGWGAVVISHLTAHYMECRSCLSGGGSDTHTQRYHFQFCMAQLSLSPSDARVGSCIVTLNLLILPRWLVGIPPPKKTFHMSWLEQNNVYALHSTTTWSIYAHAALTNRRYTHLPCSILCFFSCAMRIRLQFLHMLIHKSCDKHTATPWYIKSSR